MNICYCFLLLLGILFTNCIAAKDDLVQDSVQSTPVSTGYITIISNKTDQSNQKLDKKQLTLYGYTIK